MIEETTLFLLRHGRLVNSDKGVLNGQSDTPLTKTGLKETMRWKHCFKKVNIDLIISSDLQRTLKPAKQYSKFLEVPHFEYSSLREIDAGKWELRNVKEIMENEKDYFFKRMMNPFHIPFPSGENLSDVKKRVLPCLNKILAEHKGKKILYVGHGGIIRMIIFTYLKIPFKNFFSFEIDYGSLSILRFFSDGNVTLKLLNGQSYKGEQNV